MVEPFHTLKLTINGKPEVLKIKTDLSWGDLVKIFTSIKSDSLDNMSIGSFVELLHVFLENAVIGKDVIDPFDRTALMKMSADEVTKLFGEVRKYLPLEKYLGNLGMGATEAEIISKIIPKPTSKKTK